MAGRLPFDTNQGTNAGLTPQMRAALGLPSIEEILHFGQQRAHQEAQRDFQYRRALYQDQLDQQLQELQLRANLAQFDDLSGLRSRLLFSQHQRQRSEQEQALLRHALAQHSAAGGGGPAAAAATDPGILQHSLTEAQAAQSLHEEKLKLLLQEQDQAQHHRRAQEELLLLQHVRQAMNESAGMTGVPLSQAGPVATAAAAFGNTTEDNLNLKPPAILQARPPDFTLSPPPAAAGGLLALAVTSAIPRFGTVNDLVQAADSQEKAFGASDVLASLQNVEWSDDESDKNSVNDCGDGEEPAKTTLEPPSEPAESIVTPFFQSTVPALPCEPLFEESDEEEEDKEANTAESAEETEKNVKSTGTEKADTAAILATDADNKEATESTRSLLGSPGESGMVSNILQYPYPVDTWYPPLNSRKRERRQQEETSDEDKFEEDKDLFKETHLRANPKKIRARLVTEKEPGVLEKLPHCRLHRTRTKYTTVSELLFCFQVTETYPNEAMVQCSQCGTWRHAACGGHHKPISKRDLTEAPFKAVCENCHAEEKFLKESERGRHFLERQRIEHIRRGLASSAVMRQMAFMKHGGTYKWPLGSVSATHVGGHIRSVQLRHDKSEKQWGELASRLSRRFGTSSNKERSRVRTKELERLLVCIEDAEGLTDRHNMLLFLERDSRRSKPAGFEKDYINIFDPENFNADQRKELNVPFKKDSCGQPLHCARRGCTQPCRFDSLFCSDACGVSTLEADLLNAFHEASDIHPSLLRFSY